MGYPHDRRYYSIWNSLYVMLISDHGVLALEMDGEQRDFISPINGKMPL